VKLHYVASIKMMRPDGGNLQTTKLLSKKNSTILYSV